MGLVLARKESFLVVISTEKTSWMLGWSYLPGFFLPEVNPKKLLKLLCKYMHLKKIRQKQFSQCVRVIGSHGSYGKDNNKTNSGCAN